MTRNDDVMEDGMEDVISTGLQGPGRYSSNSSRLCMLSGREPSEASVAPPAAAARHVVV
jgi:hypothetical protein